MSGKPNETKKERAMKGQGSASGEPASEGDKNLLRRIYYSTSTMSSRMEDFESRLDDIDESMRMAVGSPVSSSDQVAPPSFETVKDRALWESKVKQAAQFRTRAVASTGLLGAQQEETLGLLEERQGFHEAVDEVNLEFASHITAHELLKRARGKQNWQRQITKIVQYLAILVVAVAMIEAVFQPSNFQLIVGGLQNPRNLLILLVVVGTVAGVYIYAVYSSRRRSSQQEVRGF